MLTMRDRYNVVDTVLNKVLTSIPKLLLLGNLNRVIMALWLNNFFQLTLVKFCLIIWGYQWWWRSQTWQQEHQRVVCSSCTSSSPLYASMARHPCLLSRTPTCCSFETIERVAIPQLVPYKFTKTREIIRGY